jgi:hypothetical protein
MPLGIDRPFDGIADPRWRPVRKLDHLHFVMRIEVVAGVAGPDPQVPEVFAGFDFHALRQLAVKLGLTIS